MQSITWRDVFQSRINLLHVKDIESIFYSGRERKKYRAKVTHMNQELTAIVQPLLNRLGVKTPTQELWLIIAACMLNQANALSHEIRKELSRRLDLRDYYVRIPDFLDTKLTVAETELVAGALLLLIAGIEKIQLSDTVHPRLFEEILKLIPHK